MTINQHLWNIALNLQSIQEEFFTNFINYFFRAIRLTKYLVDWVSADHIGYYMQ